MCSGKIGGKAHYCQNRKWFERFFAYQFFDCLSERSFVEMRTLDFRSATGSTRIRRFFISFGRFKLMLNDILWCPSTQPLQWFQCSFLTLFWHQPYRWFWNLNAIQICIIERVEQKKSTQNFPLTMYNAIVIAIWSTKQYNAIFRHCVKLPRINTIRGEAVIAIVVSEDRTPRKDASLCRQQWINFSLHLLNELIKWKKSKQRLQNSWNQEFHRYFNRKICEGKKKLSRIFNKISMASIFQSKFNSWFQRLLI